MAGAGGLVGIPRRARFQLLHLRAQDGWASSRRLEPSLATGGFRTAARARRARARIGTALGRRLHAAGPDPRAMHQRAAVENGADMRARARHFLAALRRSDRRGAGRRQSSRHRRALPRIARRQSAHGPVSDLVQLGPAAGKQIRQDASKLSARTGRAAAAGNRHSVDRRAGLRADAAAGAL